MEKSGQLHAPAALLLLQPLDREIDGPKIYLDPVQTRNTSFPCQESNSYSLAVHPTAVVV
jgi:hypothetical protein